MSENQKRTTGEETSVTLAALAREKAGYEQRILVAKANGDEIAAKKYADRIRQVDTEVRRIKKDGVTPKETTVASAPLETADES